MITSACAGDICHSECLSSTPKGLEGPFQPAVRSPVRQPATVFQSGWFGSNRMVRDHGHNLCQVSRRDSRGNKKKKERET